MTKCTSDIICTTFFDENFAKIKIEGKLISLLFTKTLVDAVLIEYVDKLYNFKNAFFGCKTEFL
jgi:hypothetical protein